MHLHFVDSWTDVLRVLVLFVSVYCVVLLLIRHQQEALRWNVKTKDLWYALLMWSLAGCVFAVQGIALDRPFTPATVFLTAAVLVTGKGVHRKGRWGGDAR